MRIKDCALVPVGCPDFLVGPAAPRAGPIGLASVLVVPAGLAPVAVEFVELEAEIPFVAPASAFGMAAERLRLVCKGWLEA